LKSELRDGKPVLTKLPELDFVDDKAGKPVGIQMHIGRRPIFRLADAAVDRSRLRRALRGLVHHTDAEREWAYDRNSSVAGTTRVSERRRRAARRLLT
jgi:hypothetical protein